MFGVTVRETFTDAPLNMVSGIGALLLADINGRPVLYTSTRAGGGMLALEISGDLSLLSQATMRSGAVLSAPPTLEIYTIGARRYLVSSGTAETTLFSWAIRDDGTLGAANRPAGGPVGVITAHAMANVGGLDMLYVSMAGQAGVQSYVINANGSMTRVADFMLGEDGPGIHIGALMAFTIGGAQFVAASALSGDRIDLFRAGAGGVPVMVGSLGAADGWGINGPGGMQLATVHGQTMLLVASSGSSSISVLGVAANGVMTVLDHVIDTLDTRFQATRVVETITIGQRAFVVTGGGDNGLTLFEILPSGKLVLLTTVIQQIGQALDNITALLLNPVAGGFEIFAAGEGTGLTRLSVAIDNLGAPLIGSAASQVLSGSGAHDLIVGHAGNNTLYGGAGNDILVGGTGSDTMFGGAGADLFVIAGGGTADTIRDFQPGIDRIDLTAWRGFRDFIGVTFTATSWGARLTLLSEQLDIYSANGLPLTREQVRQAVVAGGLWHALPVAPISEEGIYGSAANDTLVGTGDDDRLMGGAGNDVLRGGAGNDSLYGGAGDDILEGGPGADLHDGGEGRDRAHYGDAPVGLTVDLALPANNTGYAEGDTYISIEDLHGSAFADSLWGDAIANVIWGGGGDDAIYGRAGDDTLYGGIGNDTLVGGAGADLLDGGEGRDLASYIDATAGLRADLLQPGTNTGFAAGDSYISIEDLHGSAFADTLLGDNLANVIWGAAGNDVLYGRGGDDTLYGGDGNDTLIGGAGADLLDGGAGRDTADYSDATAGLRADLLLPGSNTGFAAGDVYLSIEDLQGSAFNDTLAGDSDANRLFGGAGVDSLYGRNGDDSLYGGDGNDVLIGGAGADYLDGGAGRDAAHYGDSPIGLKVDLVLTAANTGIAAGDRFVSIEILIGSAFNDILMGDAGDNALWGGEGNDQLVGRAGNDSLYGGAGNDTLFGGAGADLLDGGAGRDRAHYGDATAGLRADLLQPGTNTGFAAGDRYISIEDLYGSAFADTLLGDNLGNVIWGADGNDVLYGRGGADTLYGGTGNDTLIGGAGADLLVGGDGRDTASYIDATAGVRVDLLLPANNTGFAAGDLYQGIDDLHGSNHADILLGDNLSNRITGGAGDDILYGRGGNDILHGSEGNDVLIGGAGGDWLDGGAGRDRAHYSDAPVGLRADLMFPANNTGYAAGDTYISIEDLHGSAWADTLFGDDAPNSIWGGDGNDLLLGRGGNDILYGGNGNDTLYGGSGNDLMFGGAGADVFVFDRPAGGGNLGRIADFQPRIDRIHLDDAVFQSLRPGALAANAFHVGTAATSASHRIIYNQATGQIFYDPDGNGRAAALHFASVTAGTVLTITDFLII
ncbi:hypothetical protein HOY34_02355 [Xinfangfangia sp. D13-10-4-6]|uniref:calcium-binding protein n=1 Tax=Pseudogemmobacter hezensis TaxID=2737662 RepID=UPI0015579A31|nr:calcium-binding protein [Pseudogemmobacter hezensis]NPD14039.1 hypothetical protein [Pseudogemmobacter hezensis]